MILFVADDAYFLAIGNQSRLLTPFCHFYGTENCAESLHPNRLPSLPSGYLLTHIFRIASAAEDPDKSITSYPIDLVQPVSPATNQDDVGKR